MSLIRINPQFNLFFSCKCAEVPGWLCPVRLELSQVCSTCAPLPGKAGSCAPAAVPELLLPLSWTGCVSLTWQGRRGVFHMGAGPAQSPGSHWHLSNRSYPEAALQVSSKPRLVSFLFQQLLWLPSLSWILWPASRDIFQILLIFTSLLLLTSFHVAVLLHFKVGWATWVCFL